MPIFEGIGDEVIWVLGLILITVLFWWCLVDRTSLYRRFVRLFTTTNADPIEMEQPGTPYNNDTCPICLNYIRLGLETNCGHLFCGNCLVRCWREGSFGACPMKCPLCRQDVLMLFSYFVTHETEASDTSAIGAQRVNILAHMHHYNRLFSGQPRSLMQMIWDAPVLVRHLLNDFITEDGIMRMFQLRICFCIFGTIVYTLSPVDAIPEIIFGVLGMLDDIIVTVMVLLYLSSIYHHIMVSRAATADESIREEETESDSENI